ncbi:MAG: winged helix-turn-helix transcriptional regulator [Candidatus Nanoarchaeia archaeon]|nr:winged helix-turn-helix transcriptional regulator [Candidatus Nanoarchaeia archaeon]
MPTFHKITIIRTSKPHSLELNQEIQWISHSLGLFGDRDKEKSCFRVFIELVKSNKEDKMLSSDELAERSNLSRGTVIHHLNRLMDAGIVLNHRNRYMLRVNNLQSLINQIHRELDDYFRDLRKIAEEIDNKI